MAAGLPCCWLCLSGNRSLLHPQLAHFDSYFNFSLVCGVTGFQINSWISKMACLTRKNKRGRTNSKENWERKWLSEERSGISENRCQGKHGIFSVWNDRLIYSQVYMCCDSYHDADMVCEQYGVLWTGIECEKPWGKSVHQLLSG